MMDLDDNQANMIRAAACLLAVAAIKKSKARKRKRSMDGFFWLGVRYSGYPTTIPTPPFLLFLLTW